MIGLLIAGVSLIILYILHIIQHIMWDIDRAKSLGYELEQIKGGNDDT